MIKRTILIIIFTTCWTNCCYANWIKQSKESQIILKTSYSSYNQTIYNDIVFQNKTQTQKTDIKNNITQYNLFAEVGLTKKTSFIFSTLTSQTNQYLKSTSAGYSSSSQNSNIITNYIAAGFRRQLFRRGYFASGMQVLFIDHGKMTAEQVKMFGKPSQTIEIRHSLAIGTTNTFLNKAIQNRFKTKNNRQLKLFAIIENGVRDLSNYSLMEVRNDYTLGLEMQDIGMMFLAQIFDIYQFQYGQDPQYLNSKTKNLALRKTEATVVNNLNANIALSFSIGKELNGYLNTNANFFNVGLWITN